MRAVRSLVSPAIATLLNGCLRLQDAVVHRGKLIRMYKRPGHRVIINMDGDLIVRPTFAEASTQV